MAKTVDYLLNELKDPQQVIQIVRDGLPSYLVESFTEKESFPIKDMLERLAIPSSTYFAKKKAHKALDASSTEKFIRLMTIFMMASELLGKPTAKEWLYRPIPALGNEAPLNLLDTEVGHQLVIDTLLQIKYGLYS